MPNVVLQKRRKESTIKYKRKYQMILVNQWRNSLTDKYINLIYEDIKLSKAIIYYILFLIGIISIEYTC